LSIHFKDIMPEPLYDKYFRNNYNLEEVEEPESQNNNHNRRRGPVMPLVLCPCPADQCRGFVTRKENKCGVCEQQVCGKCLTVMNSESETETPHECQETDVQSAELILKSSKPCPKCATRIHKIDGCDQMWCTQCNTPFSWQSGREIVGHVIHNPHYYEWMRNRNPQEEGVDRFQMNNCEGMPELYTLMRHVDLVFRKNIRFTERIRNVHRTCVHYREVEIQTRLPGQERHRHRAYNYQPPPDRNPVMDAERLFRENLDIRMKWLNNELTDKSFETVLHKRYKQKLVNQRTVQVYDLIITLCSDVFHRVLRTTENTKEICNTFLTEFDEIMVYANTCFMKLEKVYNVRMPRA
jgi:hypothetical protein